MKTRISKFLAVLFFTILFAGNVNATGKNVKEKASSHEIIEELLEIEDWMISEFVWNNLKIEARETTLAIESWMTNQNLWEVNTVNFIIEDWMIDDEIWEVKDESKIEIPLAIEAWMVNGSIWKI